MKTRTIIFTVFATVILSASAQVDYSSYLNKALEKLEAGDCESARKSYNVYKELSGKSALSVEELISDCNQNRTYRLGDVIDLSGKKYIVVYIRDNGKHGYAVCDMGWDYMKRENISRKDIPTLPELKQIYANRDAVRMYDIYWTSTIFVSEKTKESSEHYYYMDFSTGSVNERYFLSNRDVAKVLFIHRF